MSEPAERRADVLHACCPDDPALRVGVSRVASAFDAAGALAPDVVTSLLYEIDGSDDGDARNPLALQPEEKLGRFRIVGKIGEGGMGSVWRAVDTSLDRDVAIKLLPSVWRTNADRLSLFRREAKVLASLNHPNIVTIHAVEERDGVPYLVMELVDGNALRQSIPSSGLPIGLLLDYAVSIAGALAAAHAKGITHRDLKPDNIMVGADGRIKILDFGLATRSARHATDVRSYETDDTLRHEAVAGTPPYMSPEQLRGLETGPQTDVFAFGILLFEMAVGHRPFGGSSMVDVVTAILRDPVPRIADERTDLPAGYSTLVEHCLERDAAKRFESAEPVLYRLEALRRDRERAALRALTVTDDSDSPTGSADSSPARKAAPDTIGVLPLQDLSPGGDLEYLCVGIADDIATALSRVRNLKITVASRMDRRMVEPVEMGRMLGVHSVLDGSVGRAGDRLRITVRLVDTRDGTQRWTERFDRAAEEPFALQDEIADAVSRTFQLRLSSAEVVASISPAARASLLQGRYFWGKRYEGGLRRALQFFTEAVAQDPSLAAAHVGQADCYIILAHYGVMDPTIAYGLARAAVSRALAVDPDVAEAHASLAWITAFHDWSWEEAEAGFEQARVRDPAYATAWEWSGICALARGRTDEGMAWLRRAHRVDPLSLMISSILGWALYTVREYEEADRILVNVLDMDPHFVFTHTILATEYALTGRFEAAVATAERGATLSGREGLSLAILGYVYGRAGRGDDAERVLEEIAQGKKGYVSPFHLAIPEIGLGRKSAALSSLERSLDARESFFGTMHFDPSFDPIRGDPGFERLLARMKLGT